MVDDSICPSDISGTRPTNSQANSHFSQRQNQALSERDGHGSVRDRSCQAAHIILRERDASLLQGTSKQLTSRNVTATLTHQADRSMLAYEGKNCLSVAQNEDLKICPICEFPL